MKCILIICIFCLLIGQGLKAQSDEAAILFDDFNYTAHDDPQLSENGWIVRAGEGWPGVEGAIWRAENVSFLDDEEGNRLLQMASSTDGSETYQTQICHQRKYYEGTYAARVRFSDAPAFGEDGDQIVQTFYLISPQEYDLDPMYSELDYEYLPNGGWGMPENTFFMTTWETFRLDPWLADNHSTDIESTEGWHTLVIQIADGDITYFVDGEATAEHGSRFYPEVPMSINFNLWFIQGGQLDSDEMREYIEQIDWVFFAAETVLSPEEVLAQVEDFRAEDVTFSDSVPEWETPLVSPCNF